MAKIAPTLLICFDRPEMAEQLLTEMHAKKAEDQPTKLFLFRDGGGNDDFHRIFQETANKRAEGTTEILMPETNLGSRNGPWHAIQWFFSHVPAGIVLEEDLQLAQEMLECYSKALKAFDDNKSIFALGSSPNHNVAPAGRHPWTKSPLLFVWGWASWTDRITKCQTPNLIWQENGKKTLAKIQTLTGRLHLQREFKKLEINPEYCWSYYPQLHALYHKLDILIPETKLTKNVGINKLARRTNNHPDDPTIPADTKQMLNKEPMANEYNPIYQKRIELAKFIGLVQEIRTRLQLGRILRKLGIRKPQN